MVWWARQELGLGPVSHMKRTPSIWYPPVQIIYIICTPRSRLYYIECTPGGTFYLDNKYPLHIIWTPPLNVEEIITCPLQVRMHMTLHVIYTTFSPSLIFRLRGPT